MNRNKILVVDDDIIAKMLADSFTSKNYQAWYCGDGVEALKLYREHSPDAILLDLHMPKKDGWEVLNEIRQEDWYTPIYVMSGMYISQEHSLRCYAKGATVFLLKERGAEEIVAFVEAQMNIRYSQRKTISWEVLTLNLLAFILRAPDTQFLLTERQTKVVALLLQNGSNLTPNEDIHRAIWGHYDSQNQKMVKKVISELRALTEFCGVKIKSSYGKGYKLHLEKKETPHPITGFFFG